jgi:hypothetical protein
MVADAPTQETISENATPTALAERLLTKKDEQAFSA